MGPHLLRKHDQGAFIHYFRLAGNVARILFVVVLISVLRPAPTRASVTVFTDLGSTNPVYNGAGYWGVASSNSFPVGMAFTPSSTYSLAQIDIALSFVSGTNSATVELLSDNGDTPGSVLETWSVTGMPTYPTNGDANTLQSLTANASVTLASGNQYWIEAIAPSDTTLGWNLSNTGSGGSAAYGTISQGGYTMSDPLSAFDVLGNAPSVTPEPSSLLLFTTGILAIALVTRRRVLT